MADDNAPIGAELGALKRASAAIEALAAESNAAAAVVKRGGSGPSNADVEREAARKRLREQEYEKPLSDAAKARKEAELEAARADRDKAASVRRTTRATQGEIDGANQRAAVGRQLASMEKRYSDALARRAGLTGPQTRVLDQLQYASRANPFRPAGADIRPTATLVEQGLARQNPSGSVSLTRAGRVTQDPGGLLRDIEVAREQIAASARQGAVAEQQSTRSAVAAALAGRERADALKQAADVARTGGVAAGAGGFGGGGGRPPAPPTGGGGGAAGGPEDIRQTGAAYERAGMGVQYFTSRVNGSENALRRHGALTTEFIEAAARGEANYREWGYQIGATAGKFAGWTAVSIPVFAALDGVRKIGQGAIESSSGVNQLQRVLNSFNPGQAQTAFRDLSRQFNVPIDVATRAVYLAGQRFHNLGDAVNAARASLFAFKTGELDVDQATQSLNAVAAAFGLKTGVAVKDTFEQVNQAQNRLGSSIPDLVQGLARAGGAFANAGGDVQGLITLLTSARLAAGRTGSQAATAVQRSAGYYLRPSNQAALRGFGIDPTTPFYTPQGPSVVGQAVNVTRQLLASGRDQDIQKLASALSSPQFASMFVPILRASAQGGAGALQNIAPIVSPEASRRSAEIELATLLRSPSEQIAAVGNELQRFGSAIGQSGFIAALTTSAASLGLVAASAEHVLNVFNRLPTSISAGTALLGGGLLLRSAGRRFGVGEDGGALRQMAFGRQPEQNARIALQQAMREQGAYLQEATRGFAIRSRQAELRAQMSIGAADAFERGGHAAQPNLSAEDYEAERVRLREVARAADNAAAAMSDEMRVLDGLARQEGELAASARVAIREGRALQFAQDQQIYVRGRTPLGPGEEPSADAAQNFRRPPTLRGILTGLGPQAQAERQAAEAEARYRNNATRGIAQREQGMSPGAAVTAYMKEAEKIGEESSLASAASRAASSGLGRLGAGLRGLGTSIYGAIGGFGVALIGIEAAYAVAQKIKEHYQRLGQQQNELGTDPRDAAAANARIANARSIAQNGDLRRAMGHLDAYSTDQQAVIKSGYAELSRRELDRQLGAAGKPRANLRADEIKQDIQRVMAAPVRDRMRQAAIVLRELDMTQDQSVNAIFRVDATKELQGALRGGQRASGTLLTSLVTRLRSTDLKSLGKDLDVMAQFVATGHAKLADVQEFYGEMVVQLTAGAPKAGASFTQRIAYQNRINQAVDSLKQGIQSQLDDGLAIATTQEQRDAAYHRAVDDYNKADDQIARRLTSNNARARQLRGALARANAKITGPTAPIPGATDLGQTGVRNQADVLTQRSNYGALLAKRDKIEEEIKANNADRSNLRRQLRNLNSRTKAARIAMERAQVQEDQDFEQLQTQAGQYDYAPGAARDTFLLDGIRRRYQQVTAAMRKGLATESDVEKVLAEQRAQQEQIVQDGLTHIQSVGNYQQALASNPANAARANINSLQKQLAYMRSNPHVYNADTQRDVQTQILQARKDLQNQQVQDINALISAQYALRESQTDDPVKKALLEYQAARSIVQHGHFDNKADRLQAQATANDKLRAYRDTKLQGREGDIDFALQMDQIDVQDAIDRYNALLKGHNLTKEEKRQIQQRVHDLQKQASQDAGNLDLDVGSIRMPTIYDVRRAFDPIRSSLKAAQSQVPQVAGSAAQPTTGFDLLPSRGGGAPVATAAAAGAVTVNVFVSDKNAAGEVYTQIDRALRTSVKSKMRSRRHR